MAERLTQLRRRLKDRGWQLEDTDPLRLTLAAPAGETGKRLAQCLREQAMECEYADEDFSHLVQNGGDSCFFIGSYVDTRCIDFAVENEVGE